MQTNPAVEQNKNIKWSESPWNQSGRKGKGLWSLVVRRAFSVAGRTTWNSLPDYLRVCRLVTTLLGDH